jgi:dihydrofolate synthase/folylpolyglutamate synthase
METSFSEHGSHTMECDTEVYDVAIQFLMDRIDYERIPAVPYREREYKLDRMREFLRRLGDPQRDFPIVHIAGTKGKGSTAAILTSICVAASYETGAYTSPHLDRLEERIAINGEPCSAAELVSLVDFARPVVEEMDAECARGQSDDGFSPPGPTYFEITTALALLHFARCKVDIAILEVGMGGRLDSTNVCEPVCSVITSISFDHTKQLGNTLAQIAREKAGIIKPRVPVVCGVTEDEPQHAIAELAQARDAPLIQLERDFEFEHSQARDGAEDVAVTLLDYANHIDSTCFKQMQLGLLGRHQAANAAVALAVTDVLARQGWQFTDEARRRGLATASCRARVELIRRNPAVVIDAAHNVASIDALLDTLNSVFSKGIRILVFATTQEKDLVGMLIRLLPQFDHVIFTRYLNNPRGVPPTELRQLGIDHAIADGAPLKAHCRVCEDPIDAWHAANSLAGQDDQICITGSFFIAAELRRLICADASSVAAESVVETVG